MPRLKPEIEEKIKQITSGKTNGKKHTPNKYKRKINRILKD